MFHQIMLVRAVTLTLLLYAAFGSTARGAADVVSASKIQEMAKDISSQTRAVSGNSAMLHFNLARAAYIPEELKRVFDPTKRQKLLDELANLNSTVKEQKELQRTSISALELAIDKATQVRVRNATTAQAEALKSLQREINLAKDAIRDYHDSSPFFNELNRQASVAGSAAGIVYQGASLSPKGIRYGANYTLTVRLKNHAAEPGWAVVSIRKPSTDPIVSFSGTRVRNPHGVTGATSYKVRVGGNSTQSFCWRLRNLDRRSANVEVEINVIQVSSTYH